jgi:gliding motility-associated-like protein
MAPVAKAQGVSADLVAVTVLDESSIQITWLLPDGPAVVRQELQRLKAGSAYEPIAVVPLGTTTFVDATVSTSDSSYAYRLRTEDVTGEVRYSNEGQSMRLRIARENAGISLSWNPYIFWARDVEEYWIYHRLQEANDPSPSEWELLTILPAGTLRYLDQTPYLPPQAICYKVEAHEREGNRATSTSNEMCELAGLVIPNTFSPNGDGINDDWYIEGLFLYGKMKCRVYDRWGREVYQSDWEHFRWDGKQLGGDRDLPDGAYYYTLELQGYDQVFKGYIMLLR